MLGRYIERRERLFHSRDTNRRSLPFEWGAEHVGLQTNGNAEASLRDFVSHALLDSATFYSPPPTEDYDFDGHVLKLPSAIDTPYPENHRVGRRFFDGRRRPARVTPRPGN